MVMAIFMVILMVMTFMMILMVMIFMLAFYLIPTYDNLTCEYVMAI